MKIGIELRHIAATGTPLLPLHTAQSLFQPLAGEGLDAPGPGGVDTRSAPPGQVLRPRRLKYVPGGPDDPATWGDIDAYEIASTGVR